MTDKDKVVNLFKELGIGHKVTDEKDSNFTFIRVKEGYDKVTGYIRFYTEFEFSKDGKFIQVGCYE